MIKRCQFTLYNKKVKSSILMSLDIHFHDFNGKNVYMRKHKISNRMMSTDT